MSEPKNPNNELGIFFGNFSLEDFKERIDKQMRESLYNLGFDSAPTIGLNTSDPAVSFTPEEAMPQIQLGDGNYYRSRIGDGENEDYGGLAALIASGEGTWDSFNRGTTGRRGNMPELLNMTIGQVDVMQQRDRDDPTRIFAVGRYQFTPGVLIGAMQDAGLSRSDVFSKVNQTRMFWALLLKGRKRPHLAAFLTGKSTDLKAAQNDLAREFAAVQDPTGRGKYDGKAGNKAKLSYKTVAKALINARTALMTNRGYVDGKLKYKG